MSGTYLSVTCPWLTTVSGDLDDSHDSLARAVEAFDDLAAARTFLATHYGLTLAQAALTQATLTQATSTQPTLTQAASTQAAEDGTDDLGEVEPAGEQIATYALRWVRSELTACLDQISGRECTWEFDGVRWHAIASGTYPTRTFLALQRLATAGVFRDPSDGPEFLDVPAVAASIAVLDTLAGRLRAALRQAGLTPAGLAAALAALDGVQGDTVPLARTLRTALQSHSGVEKE